MTETVKVLAATVLHDEKIYEFTTGPVPKGTPAAVIDALRDQGALKVGDEDILAALPPDPANPTSVGRGGEEGEPDPDGHLQPGADGEPAGRGAPSSEGPSIPDDAPDIANAEVADIAKYLDESRLNAPTTVALAEGNPDFAKKLLEAESVARGGDGRATVTGPLQKIVDGPTPAE